MSPGQTLGESDWRVKPDVSAQNKGASYSGLLQLWMPHLRMDASRRTPHLQGEVLQILTATVASQQLRIWILVPHCVVMIRCIALFNCM